MDIAIVTGASSSLGLAISKRLIQLGFRVYGLGGDYTDCSLQNVNFKPYNCDLTNPEAIEDAAKQILEKEKGVYLVVNNAKFFGRNSFFEMDTAEVENILRINLLCPLILVKALSKSLKELGGYVIQLGTPHAETSRGGPVGAAASGGLKWMGEVLFHELRSHGVRVCHLSPEPNRVRASERRVRKGARTEANIDPEAVAQAVEQMLQSPFGNVITEMILRPLRVDETDQEPVVKLPYPEPQPIPYTVPREYIEAEEQLEDEEIKQAEEKRKRRRTRKKPTDKEATPEAAEKPVREDPRRRRSPRSSKPIQEKRPADMPKQEMQKSPAAATEAKPAEEAPKRRRRRKPKPPTVAVGFHKAPPAKPEPVEKTTPEKPKAKPAPDERAPEKPKAKPARKATKKAAGKPRDAAIAEKSSEKLSPREKIIAKKIANKAAGEAVKPTPPKTPRKTAKKAVKKAARKATGKSAPAQEKATRKTVKKAVKKAARKRSAKKAAPAGDSGKESA